MDRIKFKEPVRHGTYNFYPKLTYGFEDPDAAPYFKACGWAEDLSDDVEPDVIVTLGEVDVDPLTIWGNGEFRGRFVMPDRAVQALRLAHPDRDITDEWAETYVATFVPGSDLAAQINADLGSAS